MQQSLNVALQMHYITFVYFTFESQIKTHTGMYADYASFEIIEAFNKWTIALRILSDVKW